MHASGVPWRLVALSFLVLGGAGIGLAGWILKEAAEEAERVGDLAHALRLAAVQEGAAASSDPLNALLEQAGSWAASAGSGLWIQRPGMRSDARAELSAGLLRLRADLRSTAGPFGGEGDPSGLQAELVGLATAAETHREEARRARTVWGWGLALAGFLTLGLFVLAVHLLLVHPLRRRSGSARDRGPPNPASRPALGAAPTAAAPALVQEVDQVRTRVTGLQLEVVQSGRDREVLRELRQRLQKADSAREILDAALASTEWYLDASEVQGLLRPDLRRRLDAPGRRIHQGECSGLPRTVEEESWSAVDTPTGSLATGPQVIPLASPAQKAAAPLGVLLVRYTGGEDRAEARGWVLEQIGYHVGAALAEQVALTELAEMQSRMDEAFDTLPIPLFLCTPDGNLIRSNRAFRTLFALPDAAEEEPAPLPLVELCQPGEALSRLRFPGSNRSSGPGPVQEALPFQSRTGRSFMGELSLSRHDPGGAGPAHLLGSIRDLSHQLGALADARTLSQALLQIDTALCIADRSGRVRFANPAFEAMMGMDGSALFGRFFDDPSLPFQELTGSARGLLDRLLAGEIIRGERTAFRRGEERLEARTITPIRDAAGMVTHIVSLSRDITADRSLEQQFHHAQKLDAVGRLAGGVAHDFNNLLTVIQGHVHMILAQLDAADPVREDLEGMMQASSRAGALVQQLLTFSRTSPEVPSALDVAGVLDETESLLKRLLPGHVQLRSSTPDSLPEVAMDRSQLEQILVNLVVNARDAMSGGGSIELAAWAEPGGSSSGGTMVCLQVRDTGSGIPPEVRERIFEPFFTTKEQGKGSGLGLSTVYGIVTQAGGKIEVDSTLGEGTTFTIRLPGATSRLPLNRPMARDGVPDDASGRGYRGDERILLVEDHDLVRSVTRSILKDHGYAVDEAVTAEDAITLLQAQGPTPVHDLVITDLVMPGLGGAHLARHLRTRDADFPVVFISGYRGMDELEPVEIPGSPIAMVGKPFTVLELVQAVRLALDAPRGAGSGVRTRG